MKIKYLFYILIVSFVIAQESIVTFLPQGFNIIQLGSNGFINSTVTDVSQISLGNPASNHEFNRISLGISAQIESFLDTAWIAGIGHQRLNNVQPQSFGFIIPFSGIRVGIGFGQKYNSRLDFDELEIRTVEFPEGTGETFQIEHETYVTNKSLQLSYPAFRGNNQELLVIGGRISINKLHVEQVIWKSSSQESISSHNWALGISYSTPCIFIKRIKFDAFYEKEIEFKKYVEVLDSLHFEQNYEPIIVDMSYSIKGDIPRYISMGTVLTITKRIQMICSISKLYWSKISDNYKNQVETSLNISYRPVEFLHASLGFYNTDRRYTGVSQLYSAGNKFKSTFITMGLTLNYLNFNINLSLADSHLFGGKWRKQTIGNISIGFHF